MAEDWFPYQRPTFVTPPFAGYVSGHSTYSRAASEILTKITGSPFFPGGIGEFIAKKDEFLVFEKGPSVDVVLQWATYRDASDQTSLSRIWGGIHPPADDIPGRRIGQKIADDTFDFAVPYFQENLALNDNELNTLVVYPNPSHTRQFFIANTKLNDAINVYDMRGREVSFVQEDYDTSSGVTKIRLDNCTAGMYLLRVNALSKIVIINN